MQLEEDILHYLFLINIGFTKKSLEKIMELEREIVLLNLDTILKSSITEIIAFLLTYYLYEGMLDKCELKFLTMEYLKIPRDRKYMINCKAADRKKIQ